MMDSYVVKLAAFPGYLMVPIGLFYMLAGFAVLRSVTMDALLDRAIAQITLEEVDHTDRARTVWMLATGVITFAAGAALVSLSSLAVWLFVIGMVQQVAFITLAGPYWLDRNDPPDAQARRQTTNATIIYGAATLAVVVAATSGALLPIFSEGALSTIVTLVATLGFVAAMVRRLGAIKR